MKKQHENVINALIFLLSPHLLNKNVLTLLSLPKHIANDISGHFKVKDIIKSKNICILYTSGNSKCFEIFIACI